MEITKEKLENELMNLRLQFQQAEGQVSALKGAIQTIEQLIAACDEPNEEVKNED